MAEIYFTKKASSSQRERDRSNQLLLSVLEANGEARKNLAGLFDGPYFKRIWCVQDVLVCKHGIAKCGDLEVSLHHLLFSLDYVRDMPRELFPGKSTLPIWSRIFATKYSENNKLVDDKKAAAHVSLGPMLEMLGECREFEATDKRDKIFTILGITDEGLDQILAFTKGKSQQISRNAEFIRWGYRKLFKVLDKLFYKDILEGYYPHLDEAIHPDLIPNYDKDVVDVYCDHTRLMILLERQVLVMLSHVQHEHKSLGGEYPSWVSRWFEANTAHVMGHYDVYQAGIYRQKLTKEILRIHVATLHDCSISSRAQEPKLLRLDSIRIDRVSMVTDVFCHEGHHQQLHAEASIWSELFDVPFHIPSDRTHNSHTDESLESAFYRTLAADCLTPYEVCQRLGILDKTETSQLLLCLSTQFAASYIAQVLKGSTSMTGELLAPEETFDKTPHWSQSGDTDTVSSASNAEFRLSKETHADTVSPNRHDQFQMKLAMEYIHTARKFSHNRRMYRTRSGRIGLGPNQMRAGDEVVILLGARMPFILRRLNRCKSKATHFLIGETYLHDQDVMFGSITNAVMHGRGNGLYKETVSLA